MGTDTTDGVLREHGLDHVSPSAPAPEPIRVRPITPRVRVIKDQSVVAGIEIVVAVQEGTLIQVGDKFEDHRTRFTVTDLTPQDDDARFPDSDCYRAVVTLSFPSGTQLALRKS
jgi:hypothetical protein